MSALQLGLLDPIGLLFESDGDASVCGGEFLVPGEASNPLGDTGHIESQVTGRAPGGGRFGVRLEAPSTESLEDPGDPRPADPGSPAVPGGPRGLASLLGDSLSSDTGIFLPGAF